MANQLIKSDFFWEKVVGTKNNILFKKKIGFQEFWVKRIEHRDLYKNWWRKKLNQFSCFFFLLSIFFVWSIMFSWDGRGIFIFGFYSGVISFGMAALFALMGGVFFMIANP